MSKTRRLGVVLMLVLFPMTALAETPSIRGTYELVKRVLPDGTEQMPPTVVGLADWTATHRNFNVAWHDADGRRTSVSTITTYTLSDQKYCEKIVFLLTHNLDGEGVGTEPRAASEDGCAAVRRTGSGLEVELPYEPPVLVFDDDGFVATLEGAFVDTWRKIE